MLDVILNAAFKWVQNNTDQAAWMAKRAYDSIAPSFRSNSKPRKVFNCPHCGKRYEIDADVYEREFKGRYFDCQCSGRVVCR